MTASWRKGDPDPEAMAAMDARLAAWTDRDSCTDLRQFLEVALGCPVSVGEVRIVIRQNTIHCVTDTFPNHVGIWVEGFDVEVTAPTLQEAQWLAVDAVIANTAERIATGNFYTELLAHRPLTDLAFAEMQLREHATLVTQAPDAQAVWNLLFDRESVVLPDHVPVTFD